VETVEEPIKSSSCLVLWKLLNTFYPHPRLSSSEKVYYSQYHNFSFRTGWNLDLFVKKLTCWEVETTYESGFHAYALNIDANSALSRSVTEATHVFKILMPINDLIAYGPCGSACVVVGKSFYLEEE